MKKVKLLIGIGIALSAMIITGFSTSNNHNGTRHASGMDQYTDSPPDGAGDCTGCHSGGKTTPTFTLTASPALGGSNNQFIPGTKYTFTLKLTGYSYFGFDLEIINGQASTSLDAGTLGAGTSTQKIANSGAPTNITHTSKINSTTGGTFTWTAPSTGNAYIYATIMGVNGDGSTSGDKMASPYELTLTPQSTVSVQNVEEAGNSFDVYPNPIKDHFNISYSLQSTKQVEINLYSIDGRKVATLAPSVEQSAGEYNQRFEMPSVARGIYLVQVVQDGQFACKKVVVQ